jgi:hypothetical protein
LAGARRLLAEARNLDEVKVVVDRAEAARVYARQAQLGLDAQNNAAEVRLRAESRAGDLLAEMQEHDPPRDLRCHRKGDRQSKRLGRANVDQELEYVQLWIGSSAGLAPRRILSTYLAAPRHRSRLLSHPAVVPSCNAARRQNCCFTRLLSCIFPPIGDLASLAFFRMDAHPYAPLASAVEEVLLGALV